MFALYCQRRSQQENIHLFLTLKKLMQKPGLTRAKAKLQARLMH